MREQWLQPVIDAVPGATAVDFADWEVIPGFLDGKHVCSAVMRGSEIHFAVVSGCRPILKGRTQDFLQPLFDRKGFLTTRVPLSARAERRFVERLGFERTWSDHLFDYFFLGDLPFSRTKHATSFI
jgi:hypothetical protein